MESVTEKLPSFPRDKGYSALSPLLSHKRKRETLSAVIFFPRENFTETSAGKAPQKIAALSVLSEATICLDSILFHIFAPLINPDINTSFLYLFDSPYIVGIFFYASVRGEFSGSGDIQKRTFGPFVSVMLKIRSSSATKLVSAL